MPNNAGHNKINLVREQILDFQRRMEQRYRWTVLWDLFLESLFVSTCTAVAVLLVVRIGYEAKLFHSSLLLPWHIVAVLGAAGILSFGVALTTALLRPLPRHRLAWRVDQTLLGDARYVTALEAALKRISGRFEEVLLIQTAGVVCRANLRHILPRARMGYRSGTTLALGAAAVLSAFPPLFYEKPHASFFIPEARGLAPLDIAFMNTSSGMIERYEWSFGDGETSEEESPTHRYQQPGRYTVGLTLYGPGGTDSALQENAVDVLPETKSLANFSADPLKGRLPLAVRFSNRSQNADLFRWEFGDGATGIDREPLHVYEKAGRYTVTLHASGNSGADRLTRKKYIRVMGPDDPLADFRAHPRKGPAPLAVAFENLSTGLTTSYLWDFGDPIAGKEKFSGDKNPSHTYRLPGRYTVTLKTTGPGGEDTEEKKGYILVESDGKGGGGGGGRGPSPQKRGDRPSGSQASLKNTGRLFGEKSGRPKTELIPEGVNAITQEGGPMVEKTRRIHTQTPGGNGEKVHERPLQEVYGDYQKAAEDTIQKEWIPSSVREYVRRYFHAIRPENP